jgi:penicillin G amidase
MPGGIPHLRAADPVELSFVQGRAVALDRAWQIEAERWRSEGTTAARIGAPGLEWDRFARRTRLDDTARRCYRALDAGTRRWVDAFVAGVQDGLPAGAARAPEFTALGVGPGRWRPWTPLGIFLAQHVLFGSFPHKLWREHLLCRLGDAALEVFGTATTARSGSNAWALAGDRTATGAPLLAGDPHRVIEAPGVYQQVHLVCTGPGDAFDVVGFTFPGVPGVQHFGHTGLVAWGITNAAADHQDLYREDLRRDGDRVLVREAGGWTHAAVTHERIQVRDAHPEDLEVIETSRGPVITDGPVGGARAAGRAALSVRTPPRVTHDLGFAALPMLLRARRAADVEVALRHWVEPVNSVLVADAEGTVRRFVAGHVPVRPDANRLRPVPGADPATAWAAGPSGGPARLPLPAAVVHDCWVAANDARPGDTAGLGLDAAPPHRARRISALLGDRRRLTVADQAAVQTDTFLGTAPVLQDVVRAIDPASLTASGAGVRAAVLGWDGEMGADSTGAAAFAAWRSALVRRLVAQPALRPLAVPHGYPAVAAAWLDPAVRVGDALEQVVRAGARIGLDVAAAARAALADVAASGGPRDGVATWGERHRLEPWHLLAGDPRRPGPPPPAVPLGGDTECVLAAASAPGIGDACWRGPVARYVWDLADRAASRWVVPLGAAGDPASLHATDQLTAWRTGHLLPVVTDLDRTALEETVDITAHPPPRASEATVYTTAVPGLGELSLTVLDPDRDAAVVHTWAVQDRAEFWGMGDHTLEQVRDLYAYVASLETHRAFLIRQDGRPVGVFQTYDPAHDPVGECYPVQPGDVGLHLMLAPADVPVAGFTAAVAALLAGYLFTTLGYRRVVAEPDARNTVALGRLERAGFLLDAEIDLPHKRARLAFLPRATAGC